MQGIFSLDRLSTVGMVNITHVTLDIQPSEKLNIHFPLNDKDLALYPLPQGVHAVKTCGINEWES